MELVVKICVIFTVLVLFQTCNSTADVETRVTKYEKDSVLLRKLLQLDKNTTEDEKTVSWHYTLADFFVNKLKHLSAMKSDSYYETDNTETTKINKVLTKCLSDVLSLYKKFVYDKIWNKNRKAFDENNKDYAPTTETSVPDVELYNSSKQDNIPTTEVSMREPETELSNSSNPKDEVEIIEPKYHGKICSNNGCDAVKNNDTVITTAVVATKEITRDLSSVTEDVSPVIEENKDCPQGMTKDVKGLCVDAQSGKFILGVPYHCPFGYKRDRLGFCRIMW